MEDEIFVHYGSKKFKEDLFEPIKNRYWVKPDGGLWASSVNAKYGWKDWNKDSGFRECKEENSFKFKLKANAKVCIINNVKDLELLPIQNQTPSLCRKPISFLDFEKLITIGYDAMLVNLSNDYELYWTLYGWDCDSLLVFNKDSIEEV